MARKKVKEMLLQCYENISMKEGKKIVESKKRKYKKDRDLLNNYLVFIFFMTLKQQDSLCRNT